MMRLTMAVWWSLALVWLVTSQAGAEPASGEPPPHVPVTGHGATVEAAKEDGLRAAFEKTVEQAVVHGLKRWRPSEAYVRERLVVGAGHPGADAKDPQAKTWVYEVAIPDVETLKQLDRQALRQERAEIRLSWALRTVAGLALALAVLIGCIRADEWTRSRYTMWLRLAGASAFVAIGAGWLWLW